jgi:hypothetical protein
MKEQKEEYHNFSEDYLQLLENPVSYEEFKKRYMGQIIPIKHQYDLFLLVHMHRKQLERLRVKLDKVKKE